MKTKLESESAFIFMPQIPYSTFLQNMPQHEYNAVQYNTNIKYFICRAIYSHLV